MKTVKSAWRYVWGSSSSSKSQKQETPQETKPVQLEENSSISGQAATPIPVSTETEKLFTEIPPTFKVVVVGDGGVGKTTYVKMLSENGSVFNFDPVYKPTMGVEVVPIRFTTNKGVVVINFWDCAGQEKYLGLGDGYYIGAHGFIMTCSMDSVLSFKNLPKWLKSIRQASVFDENIAIVATKLDITSKTMSTLPSKIHDIPTFEVSSKQIYPSNKHVITYLLQQMMKDPTVTLV